MTYNNGFGGRHRNGDKRRPAQGKAQASGDRTSRPHGAGAGSLDGQPGPGLARNQTRPPQGNYPYPAVPSGGGAAPYREPAASIKALASTGQASGTGPAESAPPRQHRAALWTDAPLRSPVRAPAPVQPAAASTAPQYNHPSGPMRQYNPPPRPVSPTAYNPPAPPMPPYNPPSGPMRQYNPPSGPAPQYNNHPSGPLPQYDPPPAPQYNHPSGPLPQYDPPLAAPIPQYENPSGPMRQYDMPSGPCPGTTIRRGRCASTARRRPRRAPVQPPVRADAPVQRAIRPDTPVQPARLPRSPVRPASGPMQRYSAPTPEYAVQYARDGVADLLDRLGKESGKLWTVDSVRLANQILSTANHQAAELRHEAHDQATASLAEARQEADALHAAGIRPRRCDPRDRRAGSRRDTGGRHEAVG